jgi:hypothetical protein
MTAAFNIALPGQLRVPPRLAQTWTIDADGRWVRKARQLWRDERGWHDRPITTPEDDRK